MVYIKDITCPDCGSRHIELNGAEVFCQKCGLVISTILFSEQEMIV